MLGFILSVLYSALLGTGWAGTFVVETPPMKTRVEALKQLRVVAADGFNARLIKRYRHGVGFEYIVTLPGFQTLPEAQENALALSALLGASLSVYEPGVESDDEEKGENASRPEIAHDMPRAWRQLAFEQLRWVAEKNGFLPALGAATQVDFQFLWTGPDNRVERRRYVREQDTEFVEIGPKENRIELWLEPDEAWVKTNDGRKRMISRGYAESLLHEQSPSRVLGSGLEQLNEVLERDLAPALFADGLVEVGSTLCYLLRGEIGPSRTPISLAFDTQRYRLRQIVVGAVGRAWAVELGGYHEEINGMNIPHAISVWFRGDILYQFNIDVLNISFAENDVFQVPPDDE